MWLVWTAPQQFEAGAENKVSKSKKLLARLLLMALVNPLILVPSVKAGSGFLESAKNHMTYSWRARAGGQVVREIKSEYTLCSDGTEGCTYQTNWLEDTTWHRDNVFSKSRGSEHLILQNQGGQSI